MRRLTIVAIALVAAGAALSAQDAWRPLRTAETSASVVSPCEMQPTRDIKAREGDSPAYTDITFSCFTDDVMYLFGFTTYEAGHVFDADTELKTNRDKLIKNISGATLLTNSAITVGGLRGLAFTVNVRDLDLITSRVFIVGKTPYMLVVMTPLRANNAAGIQRFLDSFTPPH